NIRERDSAASHVPVLLTSATNDKRGRTKKQKENKAEATERRERGTSEGQPLAGSGNWKPAQQNIQHNIQH
ncbi:hypothetical protein B9K06_27360, partial [Bacillus sp. OG2]